MDEDAIFWKREAERLKAEIEKLLSEKLPIGAECGNCGFRYWEHEGHIIPCPQCQLAQAKEALKLADDVLVATEWPNVKRAKEKIREALKDSP